MSGETGFHITEEKVFDLYHDWHVKTGIFPARIAVHHSTLDCLVAQIDGGHRHGRFLIRDGHAPYAWRFNGSPVLIDQTLPPGEVLFLVSP